MLDYDELGKSHQVVNRHDVDEVPCWCAGRRSDEDNFCE